MIDKSIRQHYQEGDKVKKLKLIEMGEKLTSPLKNKYIAQETGKIKKGEIAKDIGINFAKKAVAKKLGLASLNPILGLLSLFGFNPFKNWGEGGVKQAYQAGMTGFGSPAEGRELRQLEARRANMLQRKEAGKSYSDKNLSTVTKSIAKAKGIDINNPNEMKNIDKPITQTRTEKSITETPKKVSPISYEDDFAKTTIKDLVAPTVSNPNEDRAREEKEAFDRAVAENAAKAAAEAAAQRAYAARVPDRIYGGGNGGGGGGGGGGQAAADARGGSSYSSPFAKGGRVDKALEGRSRDI